MLVGCFPVPYHFLTKLWAVEKHHAVFTYVVEGRLGMNETGYFSLDM